MICTKDCPSVSDLQLLISGQFLEVDAAPLERHLESCSSCFQSLRSMALEDSFTMILSGCASGSSMPREISEAAERLIARLQQAPPFSTVGGDRTSFAAEE